MKVLEEQLQLVEFENSQIEAFQMEGVVHCVVKRTCEYLGIRYDSQQKRIKKDPVLSQLSCLSTIVADDGRVREMLCFDKQGFLLWLAKINAGKVPNSELLIKYQLKAAEVLESYFFGGFREHYMNTKREAFLVARNKKLAHYAGKYHNELQQNRKELDELRGLRIQRLFHVPISKVNKQLN